MIHIIASSRAWNEKLAASLAAATGDEFILIHQKDDLTFDKLRDIRPRYVFFPHWSYLVPAEIYNNFECVIFHMTDLPFGRGGSPLQNLIARGIYETKISALRCQTGLDAGPIYMKSHLSLHGTAEEIYLRASKTIGVMIESIVRNQPKPVQQTGEIISFERRKPEEGNIAGLKDLQKVFDYIRMLDADGYPAAFLETDHMRFEFKRPSMKYGKIVADVTITQKKRENV